MLSLNFMVTQHWVIDLLQLQKLPKMDSLAWPDSDNYWCNLVTTWLALKKDQKSWIIKFKFDPIILIID